VFVLARMKVDSSGAPSTTTTCGQQDVGLSGLSGSAVLPQLKQFSFVPFAVGVPSQQRGVAPSGSQTTPQPPQLFTSSITSMHEPSQHFSVAEQASPQLAQSVSVLAVGVPSQQRGVGPSSSQTTPHPPQFATLSITSMHDPPQHFSVAEQASPQSEQLVSVPSWVHSSTLQHFCPVGHALGQGPHAFFMHPEAPQHLSSGKHTGLHVAQCPVPSQYWSEVQHVLVVVPQQTVPGSQQSVPQQVVPGTVHSHGAHAPPSPQWSESAQHPSLQQTLQHFVPPSQHDSSSAHGEGQPTHDPFLQVSSEAQGPPPQPPQLALSVWVSTHSVLQQVFPFGQPSGHVPSPLQPAVQFSVPIYSPTFACDTGSNDAFGIQ